MDTLKQLRLETFRTAGLFHQAQAEFFAALSRDGRTGLNAAAEKVNAAGAAYRSALENLIAGLVAAEPAATQKEEIARTAQKLVFLERELELLAVHLKA